MARAASALLVAIGLATGTSVKAQDGTTVQLQFRPVVFSQQEGRTDSSVGPDNKSPIIRTAAQIQSGKRTDDADADIVIRTDLPGPERLFDTRKSEAMMRESIRRDSSIRSGPDRVIFPEYPPLTTAKYTGRHFPQSFTKVEPNYVCHGRLFFEQQNFERAGWDLGYITPLVNVGEYYYDLAMLPYHAWTDPCRHYDCSAGKCLPGDRTPLYLYREPFSFSGLAAETLVLGTGLFIFP